MLQNNSTDKATKYTRTSLAAQNSTYDENWLQKVLFANPELIPIQEINPGTGGFIPIRRELSIPKAGSTVFLDIFGITPEGKPVLIECKLWRNPQARREVIAQILEYASLMRHWSYGDLSARIKSTETTGQQNPLFSMVEHLFPQIEEAKFVDQVSTSLKTGDFILIIAGDGIRSDVHAIADHLNTSSGLASKMALVEFQLWEGEADELMIIPTIPLRTELLRHRIFLDESGVPIAFNTESNLRDDTEAIIDPDREAFKQETKAFWQSYIDKVEFDHPDQPQPRHGGHGWVRIEMPQPAGWMTAFRAKKGKAGLFMRFKGDDGMNTYLEIETAKKQLEADCGLQLEMSVEEEAPFSGLVSFSYDGDPTIDGEFLDWLFNSTNKVINTFRPFLKQQSRQE